MKLVGATKTGRDMRSLPGGFTALLGLLAMVVSALALAPRTDAHTNAHIYWTIRGGDIGRANLDGPPRDCPGCGTGFDPATFGVMSPIL